MHTSLLLFLLANVVIGTPLSLNQRHNSEDISRREDTNTVPGIYSQAESSNINNNKELNFFANLPKIVDDNEALTLPAPLTPENIIPVAPPTPIEVPFTCSPQSASDAVPGGEQELQQACCKTTDEVGSTIPKGCIWYVYTEEVCMNEKYWRCCQDVSNGGSGCTTTVMKKTPPADNLVVPEVQPGKPTWQNYMRQSFVPGLDDLWQR